MRLFFWVCFVLVSGILPAQTPGTYIIKPGVGILEVIPVHDIFLYPQFEQGTVVFKDGTSTAGRLNYNMLLATIQFVDPKGDTLSLANEQLIKHILVVKDTFYYSDAFLRIITGNGSVKLAERVFYREFIQKPGSYELSSATTATNTISSILEKRAYALNTDQELILKKSNQYYIGNRFNDFVIADKKNVLKLFQRHHTVIRNYFNEHAVDFTKAGDMQSLVIFLQAL